MKDFFSRGLCGSPTVDPTHSARLFSCARVSFHVSEGAKRTSMHLREGTEEVKREVHGEKEKKREKRVEEMHFSQKVEKGETRMRTP